MLFEAILIAIIIIFLVAIYKISTKRRNHLTEKKQKKMMRHLLFHMKSHFLLFPK